ncbi:MAG TPA: hypothetical protein VD862_03715 [Candidatus Paceibacterota bacterium]|nr:hypothetical protein [Candidatus Paceibacterota bacterium]
MNKKWLVLVVVAVIAVVWWVRRDGDGAMEEQAPEVASVTYACADEKSFVLEFNEENVGYALGTDSADVELTQDAETKFWNSEDGTVQIRQESGYTVLEENGAVTYTGCRVQ